MEPGKYSDHPIADALYTEEEAMTDCERCNIRCCLDCEMAIRKELAEWRSGKRRVFWRVRFNQFAFGPTYIDLVRRNNAIKLKGQLTSTQCSKLYRVTVRPKGAKR